MKAERQFPWSSESELLVWCARTCVTEELRARIGARVGEPLDWGLLLDLAAYHGVLPLLYRNLSTICPALVPGDTLTKLRQKTQACALLNRSLAQELGNLCAAFAAHSVPVVPIKGATLALSAYGDLTLRDFSDLDLLIPESAVGAAQTVLFAQGYERKDPSADSAETEHDDGPYHVFIKKRSLFRVDLQWVMAHQHFSFQLDRPEFWAHRSRMVLGTSTVHTLAPEELLILLCVHGSKHAWEQLKWVCDVAELLRSHPDLDWTKVFSQATAWRCLRLVHIGLALADWVLDAPIPESIRARYSDDVDVGMLSERMPASLLANPRNGVSEEQAVAFYFLLKDTWWERWRFGLALCRDGSSIVDAPPSWFSRGRQLTQLSHLVRPCQRAVRNLVPSPIRGTINRWVDHGS
ncbi:MAG: nucleotidyltransferase family protein [Nitrospira sp.]|nr:nucleotidyltransferase family protein [Nitrospira sp.]